MEEDMPEQVLIFGKDSCPFTRAAREAYAKMNREFDYFDVLINPEKLEDMLRFSGGRRKVPVIVEGESVTIGFQGKA
jgi:glutaredoxin 3